MAGSKESPEEKLTKLIEGILDAREQRKAIESDPKKRGERLAERLEAFLDGLEEENRAEESAKKKPGKDEKDDGNVLSAIFGG